MTKGKEWLGSVLTGIIIGSGLIAAPSNVSGMETLSFSTMINSGTDMSGALTGTYTPTAAGTATLPPGNANHGNTQVGGSLTIMNHDSDVADGNTTAAGPPASITLNNYVVNSFSFNQSVTLMDPFRVHDLDTDHAGANEYHDAIGIVLESGGSLFLPAGGGTISTLPGGSNQDGSWQVTSVNATVGANAAGGPNLLSLGSIPVYFHVDPIDSGNASVPNSVHANNDIGVEFLDTTVASFDAIHIVYFNAIDTDETAGVQGVSISNDETFNFAAIPEPSTTALVFLGLGLVYFRNRRRLN